MNTYRALRPLLFLAIGSPLACGDMRGAATQSNAAKARAAIASVDSAGAREPDALSAMDSARAAPPRRITGYLVRGTDESSFRVCGTGKVHFLPASSASAVVLLQEYRFRATGLLRPIYFVIKGRVLPDTVIAGANRYTSVLQVTEFLGGKNDTPECPPPRPGTLIGEPGTSTIP